MTKSQGLKVLLGVVLCLASLGFLYSGLGNGNYVTIGLGILCIAVGLRLLTQNAIRED